MREEHIDLFDRYLKNLMHADEIAVFEKRLSEDSDFAAEFDQYRLLAEGIRAYGRDQLKNFLKENAGSLVVHKPIQPRRIMLMAASVVLVIGVIAIIKLSIKPLAENNLAIQSSPESTVPMTEIETTKDSVIIEDTKQETDQFRSLVSVEKEKAIDAPPAISDIRAKDLSEVTPQYLEEDFDYKVLSDEKIKDTMIKPVMLAYNETENLLSNDANVNFQSAGKTQSSLPYNVYSGGNAPVTSKSKPSATAKKEVKSKANQSPASSDTMAKVQLAESKKALIENLSSVNLQYWKSPINYSGYTYDKLTLKVFGFEPGTCKLYTVNGTLYLRHNEQVYLIETCKTSCAFILVTNPELLKLILSH